MVDNEEESMTDLPQLTESDIHSWTDPASFGRGQRYHRDGHIINPRRQGTTLKARCIGSRPQPYRVEITLAPGGIAHGYCSCPVGFGGHCKHAVALLLTWLHEPHTVTTVEDIETALERRTKGELIVLIRRMLDRYPDLEVVLDLPVVAEAEKAPPVNGDVIRRQARTAFAGLGYQGWEDAYDIAQQLLNLVEVGDDYAGVDRWEDAATIYRIVMEETLDNYRTVRDEAMTLARRLFWHRPTLAGYRELKALARPLGRWTELRTTLIARLDEERRHVLSIEIYLQEGEVDGALKTLQKMDSTSARLRADDELMARVAEAAEEERPRDAIRLYVEAAEGLIAYRGRHNYATTATYLKRVRALYQHLGEASTWHTYIAALRDDNRRLRALKDELNKAGL